MLFNFSGYSRHSLGGAGLLRISPTSPPARKDRNQPHQPTSSPENRKKDRNSPPAKTSPPAAPPARKGSENGLDQYTSPPAPPAKTSPEGSEPAARKTGLIIQGKTSPENQPGRIGKRIGKPARKNNLQFFKKNNKFPIANYNNICIIVNVNGREQK